MKVLAILYSGGAAAQQEPRLLGTTENELGIREYLESQGHEYFVSISIYNFSCTPSSHLPTGQRRQGRI